MENIMRKTRDLRMDCLKGIAISLVVIGHILQFSYENYGKFLIFNIIWTLQIPLFIVISGYFAEKKGGGITLSKFKKIISYLIPFFSCFLIRELLIRGNLDLINSFQMLFFNLEDSLWYLFVLFELSIVHMVAMSLSQRFGLNPLSSIKGMIIYSLFYGLLLLPFVALSFFVGTDFLGSKYALYYSLFYWLGFVWRILMEKMKNKEEKNKRAIYCLLDIGTLLAFIVYIVLILRVNIFELNDSISGIFIRFIASASAVYLVIRMVFIAYQKEKHVARFLSYLGEYTLEIYYIHYLFIPYIAKMDYPLMSPIGVFSLGVSYFAVLLICALVIMFVKTSPLLTFVIFGKRQKLGG